MEHRTNDSGKLTIELVTFGISKPFFFDEQGIYALNMQYVNRAHRHLQLKNNRTMEERRRFMKELRETREAVNKECRREIKDNVGPTWYQVLSERHKIALDTLSTAIYKDFLEGRSLRTTKIIRVLGILPRPNNLTVQYCMNSGQNDPKEFLAQLFYSMYGHPISGKRYSYDLNMKMILSSIYYLGLDELIKSLKEQFKPDKPAVTSPALPKKKRAVVHSSPYLQKMVAPLYQPVVPKRKRPPPLPDLSFLNADVETESTPQILRKPPQSLPPPPVKKEIDRSKCDELAGIISFTQKHVPPKMSPKLPLNKKGPNVRRLRVHSSKTSIHAPKKTYGIGNTRKQKVKNLKPEAPSTGLKNMQYNIVGVYTFKEKSYYIIGDVITLPSQGILMNGGLALFPNGKYRLIHLGYGGHFPVTSNHCECVEKWESAVFRNVENTKCYCDHPYDFRNEGTFSEDEVPFFTKPTRKAPMHFNYNAIYEIDPKLIHVYKEAKKLWENDSILQEDNDSEIVEKRKTKKKKILKYAPQVVKNCLGDQPVIEDYLRCGLRFMARINVAARLPDVYLSPELKAWMRLRIYGPYTTEEKNEMLKRSLHYWSYFKACQTEGLGKANIPSLSTFSVQTTWSSKPRINVKFKKTVHDYRIQQYKAQAYANNLLWATAYNAEYPDKKFREIYFTYLPGCVDDVVVYNPCSR